MPPDQKIIQTYAGFRREPFPDRQETSRAGIFNDNATTASKLRLQNTGKLQDFVIEPAPSEGVVWKNS